MTDMRVGLVASLFIMMLTPGARAQEDLQAELRAGVERLQFLKGEWRACVANITADGERAAGDVRMAEFRPSMNDLYLETEIVNSRFRYHMLFSYDVVQKRYRIASRDDQSGLLDIYEGVFDDGGALVLTNLKSGTHYAYKGVDYYNRLSFKPAGNGWTSTVDATNDGGKSWRQQLQIDATPAKGDEGGASC
ncbi:MAG: hypothetical protein R3C58_01720 [Parvularculaceae bacterium]